MIDFFNPTHNPQKFTEETVWLADTQDATAAYITFDDDDPSCVAKVLNSQNKAVTFVAIDNNIDIQIQSDGNNISRCDGMLHYDNALFFVELKNQRNKEIRASKDQLISTIDVFRRHHKLDVFRKKRAYACNVRHPSFCVFDREEIESFANRTGGFKFFFEGRIVIQ